MRALAAAAAAALACAGLCARAWAGDASAERTDHAVSRVHVVLIDGSELQGELVERVPGDHLTLQLATGEIRRLPWASIASSREVGGATETLPPLVTPESTPLTPLTSSPPLGAPRAGTDVIRGWPRPDRRPPTFSGEHYVLGVGGGVGSPTGYVGALAGYEPAPWCELQLGAGLGGRFGYAVAATGRLQAVAFGAMRFGLGVGLSTNYAPSPSLAGAPKQTQFLNLDFNQDYALGRSAFLRLTSGVAFLLNPGGFEGLCPKDATSGLSSCAFVAPFPADARAAASAADHGRTVVMPYFGLELLWMSS